MVHVQAPRFAAGKADVLNPAKFVIRSTTVVMVVMKLVAAREMELVAGYTISVAQTTDA